MNAPAPLLFLAVLSLAACASEPAAPSSAEDFLRSVQSARTRAEHEGLAARYESQAYVSRVHAERHRKMAQGDQGVGRGNWSMPAHCRALAGFYEAHALEYDAMSIAQRQLAAVTQ